MGKVFSVVSFRVNRAINRFNAENRAHKVISQEKPTPAPKYDVNIKEMENLMKENPHKFDDMKKKDPVLNENLKTIYVTSSDPQPKVFKKIGKPSESRMLPVDRRTKLSDDLAFMEPEVIPAGKISLKQALKILSQHQSNSEAYNMYYVSDNYKIGKEVAENILHYYKTFKVYIPPKEPKLSVQAKFNQFLDSQTRFDDSVDNSQQKLP